MSEGHDHAQRRLSRQDLLKLAAVAGGAGVLASRAGAAGAALERLTAETGRLQVLDWAGYGNDGGQAMFAQYVKEHPRNKPQFTFMTVESNGLAKMRAGYKPDVYRPYVAWVKFFVDNGYAQPWDTSLIPNFKHLNPFMIKAGQYQGKQYGIPEDWGLSSIMYRPDKVQVKNPSWGLFFDDRYSGKIAWFDDLYMLVFTGMYLGFKNPWNMTDDQLKQAQKLLISKKKHVRMIWSSEADMQQAFAGGDVWIAFAWPNDWVAMKKKGVPAVYMRPKEKPLAWVGMFMLNKGTPRYDLAHAYVDAWSSAKSAKWLEDNYGVGHSNTLVKPSSSALLRVLQLSKPDALSSKYVNFDRDVPRRAVYTKLWEEVKAS